MDDPPLCYSQVPRLTSQNIIGTAQATELPQGNATSGLNAQKIVEEENARMSAALDTIQHFSFLTDFTTVVQDSSCKAVEQKICRAMGIPMIHTHLPTSTSSDVPESSQSDLQALLNKRTEIETSLDEYSAVLDRNRIDLNTPLITVEGYPRADIDVANVRIARAAIIRLRNDYRALERQIERAVHEAFKNGEPLKIERVSGAAASSQQLASAAADVAFCYINSVAEGSPAQQAGLRKDDRIIKFGTTTITNNDKLQGLAREVQRAVTQQVTISITISRSESTGTLISTKELTPSNTWGGRGAVGAHFLPC